MAQKAQRQTYIIRDNKEVNLTLGGPNWIDAGGSLWYGGGLQFAAYNASNAITAWAAFNFTGQGFAIIGNSAGKNDPSYTVQIDSQTPYTSSLQNLPIQAWIQWYTSPVLSTGAHTVNISGLVGQAIDMIIIDPAPKTPLKDEWLVVDDTYEGVRYNGNGWIVHKEPLGNPNYQQVPFGNSTHQSEKVGDSFEFRCSCTKIQFYGSLHGTTSLSYSIDNGTFFTKDVKYDGEAMTNFKFLETDTLRPGNHSVVVALEKGQPLNLDYVVYKPSFGDLESMPDLFSSGQSGNSGSNGDGKGNNNGNNNPDPTPKKTTPIGAIVGGAIGAIVALALIAYLIFFLRRRRRQEDGESEFKAPAPNTVTPYTPMYPTNNGDTYHNPTTPATDVYMGYVPPPSSTTSALNSHQNPTPSLVNSTTASSNSNNPNIRFMNTYHAQGQGHQPQPQTQTQQPQYYTHQHQLSNSTNEYSQSSLPYAQQQSSSTQSSGIPVGGVLPGSTRPEAPLSPQLEKGRIHHRDDRVIRAEEDDLRPPPAYS